MSIFTRKSMKTLNEIISKGKPQEIKRALAVKMNLSGEMSNELIGELLGISQSFISKWKKNYKEKGIECLCQKHKGKSNYLNKKAKEEIRDYIKKQESIKIEDLIEYIENEYNVKYKSKESYYSIMKENGMSWHKTKKTNPNKNEEKIWEKREEIKKK